MQNMEMMSGFSTRHFLVSVLTIPIGYHFFLVSGSNNHDWIPIVCFFYWIGLL
ncbi:hypothetical protein ACIQXV_24790 [Neobacillus sp. NPDC097160]|uniref:hypothetical protein n=1 Tax=Neobacillus sp. NPDC097160 TaxID=3364298 RepID=UPI0037FCD3FC